MSGHAQTRPRGCCNLCLKTLLKHLWAAAPSGGSPRNIEPSRPTGSRRFFRSCIQAFAPSGSMKPSDRGQLGFSPRGLGRTHPPRPHGRIGATPPPRRTNGWAAGRSAGPSRAAFEAGRAGPIRIERGTAPVPDARRGPTVASHRAIATSGSAPSAIAPGGPPTSVAFITALAANAVPRVPRP